MASGNINLRDPAIYRIRKATHHNTGDAWCIYPMYTYAHPIEDALENITHSICTLEFEDQRPFYDWLLGSAWPSMAASHAAAAADRVRAPEPDLCGAVQAQADPAGRRKARRRLGRPAPAHPGRRAPPRLHGRGLPPLRRDDRRHQVGFADRLQRVRGMPARCAERTRAAPHRRARPAEAGHRQLSGRPGGVVRSPQPSAAAGAGQAPGAVREGTLDRARGLHGSAEQGLFPPLPRQQGAPALRLRRRMHRLRQGCRRQCRRRALQLLRRLEIGHAGRRTPTRSRATSTGSRRGTPMPPRCGSTTGCSRSPIRGRARLPRGHQSRFGAPIVAQLEPSLKDAAPEDRFQFERHGYFVADRVDSRPAPRCSTAP
jgi:glutaminyl-tRNA synthetase